MRIIDISGPIEDGMWSYDDPYPTPRITQILPPAWLAYPVYSQTVTMAVQNTTAATRAKRDELMRLFMTPRGAKPWPILRRDDEA